MLPGTAGGPGSPTLTCAPPEAFRDVQSLGSRSQSDGMLSPGTVVARITAEACVVGASAPITPAKKVVRFFATVTLNRSHRVPSVTPVPAVNRESRMSPSSTGNRKVIVYGLVPVATKSWAGVLERHALRKAV